MWRLSSWPRQPYTPIYTGDGGESVNEDPLSAARGIINGLIFSIPIWAIIVGLYQLW